MSWCHLYLSQHHALFAHLPWQLGLHIAVLETQAFHCEHGEQRPATFYRCTTGWSLDNVQTVKKAPTDQ